MTFQKPTNVTFTQMAQWIDNHLFTDKDDEILCQYLYHLVCLKAQKLSLYTDYEQLDDFSLYCASKLFFRLKDTDLQPVKSITNYIKTVIVPWHAQYIREFCVGSPDSPVENFDVVDFSDYLIDSCSEQDFNSYAIDCFRVSDVFRNYLTKIPYKRNSAEWSNIYISCLLTLNDRIDSAIKLFSDDIDETISLSVLIRRLRCKDPILYHIDEIDSTYIKVLVNELIHALAAELSRTTRSYVSASACLKNLVIAASSDEEDD